MKYLSTIVAALLVHACVPYRGQPNPLVSAPNDYKGAAVFAGTGVGASVANRAVTGGCYAQCAPGFHCNTENGLCEPNEECGDDDEKPCAHQPATTASAAPKHAAKPSAAPWRLGPRSEDAGAGGNASGDPGAGLDPDAGGDPEASDAGRDADLERR